jgi:hypothetical protein
MFALVIFTHKNPKSVYASTSKLRRIIMCLMQEVTGISVNNTKIKVNPAVIKLRVHNACTLYNKAGSFFLLFVNFPVKIRRI